MHAKLKKLETLVAEQVRRFDYAYDFGDGWRLTVAIQSIAAGDRGVM
jgi:hypothetical protein